MGYDLGLDLGGGTVVAAVLRGGRDAPAHPTVARLAADGGEALPAVALRSPDGVVHVGEDAERLGATAPDRVVREATARVGDPVAPVVGGTPWRAADVAAELVLAAVRRVAAAEGGVADALAVTRPDGWGEHRARTLRHALTRVGLGHAVLLGESDAAVRALATRDGLPVGTVVAVLDVGARSTRATVVRRGAGRRGGPALERLADSGTPHPWGGADVDDAVLALLRAEIGGPAPDPRADPRDPDGAARAAAARRRRAAVAAKEILSAETDTVVDAGPGTRPVRLTRADLEAAVEPDVRAVVELLAATVDAGGHEPDRILLVGGTARIPMLARTLAAELARPVRADLDPGTVVAVGASLAAAGRGAVLRSRAGVGSPTEAAVPAGVALSAGAGRTAGRARTAGAAASPAPSRVALAPRGTAATTPATVAGSGSRTTVLLAPPDTTSAPSTAPTATLPVDDPDGPAGGPTAVVDLRVRGPHGGVERHTERGPADVPRPPVASGPVPAGLVPAPRRRHTRGLLVAAAVLVLGGIAAATVPIPGLTTARVAPAAGPAVVLPPPGAPAPPPPPAATTTTAAPTTTTAAPTTTTSPETTTASATEEATTTASPRARATATATSTAGDGS